MAEREQYSDRVEALLEPGRAMLHGGAGPRTDAEGVIAPCCLYSQSRMECETDCGNCNVCRLTARIDELEVALAGTTLEMVEGGLYRNVLNAELRLIAPAYCNSEVRRSFDVLAPGLWVAEGEALVGVQQWLVTAEGMAACGYSRVTEEPTA